MNCKNCGKYSGKYPLCKECYYAEDIKEDEEEEIEEETDEEDEEYEEEEKLKCPVCGEPTFLVYGHPRKDRLCWGCSQKLFNKEIELCSDCKAWHSTKETCKCKTSTIKTIIKEPPKENDNYENDCIICKKPTNGGWRYLCFDCYKSCLEYTKEMNKNYDIHEFRNYYYNAKSNIYTLTGFENFIKPNCIKLIAIAKACSRYAQSDVLLNMVKQDVIEIIHKKKSKDIIKETEEEKVVEFNVKKNRGAIRGVDGHFLDSDKEKEIDDLLFSLAIPHAIHYNVPSITERAVICDWYIPVLPGKGIYIEYFGMDTSDYVRNMDEKIELYRKHGLKLIRIEKDETMDTQRLTTHIQQEHARLKKEIYDAEN